MVQKLKLRHKSPNINYIRTMLKNVRIISEKCPGSRIPGSRFLESLQPPWTNSLGKWCLLIGKVQYYYSNRESL